jgi:hypothetical protein
LQESETGSYVFNSGNSLGLGPSAGSFTIVSSGGGYTIQDQGSGLYVNSPWAQSPPNRMTLSSSPTVWTATLVSGGDGLTEIDDTDSSVVFSDPGAGVAPWGTGNGGGAYDGSARYNNGCSSAVQSDNDIHGVMAAINFTGTEITLIGAVGDNFGIGYWSVDGGAQTGTVDAYSPTTTYNYPLFTVSGLSNTSHVLKYEVSCTKNPSSSNYYQVVDAYKTDGNAISLSSAQVGPALGGDVTLSGNWSSGYGSSNLSGTQIWGDEPGSYIEWSFTGSLIEIYGRPDIGDGYFDVYIDGGRVAQNVNSQYGNADNDLLSGYMLWAGKVSYGTHTIRVVVDGSALYPSQSENSGLKNLVQFDEFLAFP